MWLFSGLFLVQLINLGFAFIHPRIYSPADFAQFGLFLASVMILFEVNNFRLDQALMLPSDETTSIALYKKAIRYSTLFSIGLLLLLGLYRVTPLFNEQHYFLFWIPVSVFINGIYQPTITYCNRHQHYRLINQSRILQAFFAGAISCIPYLIKSSQVYLIQGFITGQIASSLLLLPVITKAWKTDTSTVIHPLKAYGQFPKYGTWSSLLNAFSRNAIFYLLNFFFTPASVGLYTFTNRLIQAPLGVVTSAVGQAYFRDASMASSHKALQQLTKNIFLALTGLALIPVILALGWGPDLFSLLFGEAWRGAGEIARYLALWYGTSLVVTPLSMLVDVKGRLKWELGYNIAFFLARIIILLIGGYWGHFAGTMWLFCLVSVIFNIYLLIFVKQLTRHEN